MTRPFGGDPVLEELRLRVYKLVAGDTWESHPELRVAALRRFFFYVQKEKRSQARTQAAGFGSAGPRPPTPPPTTTEKMLKAVQIRIPHKLMAPTLTSWGAAFEELTKAGGPKLVPLLIEVMGALDTAERQVAEYETLLATHQLVPRGAVGLGLSPASSYPSSGSGSGTAPPPSQPQGRVYPTVGVTAAEPAPAPAPARPPTRARL